MATTRFYQPGMDWGVGVDVLTHQARGHGVEAQEPIGQPNAQSTQFIATLITSSYELQQAIRVPLTQQLSAAMSGGLGPAGQLLNPQGIEPYSVWLVLQATSTTRRLALNLTNTHLLPDAASQLVEQGADAFRQSYGDEFVGGMTFGSRYYAVANIDTPSDEDTARVRQMLALRLPFGDLTPGWTVDLIADALASIDHDYQMVSISQYSMGGVQANEPAPGSLSEIFNRAAAFLNSASDETAVPIEVETWAYRDLSLPANTFPLDVTDQELAMRQLAYDWLRLKDLQVAIQYVQRHPERFEDVDNTDLTAQATALQASLDTVLKMAGTSVNNVQDLAAPADVDTTAYRLPNRKVATAG